MKPRDQQVPGDRSRAESMTKLTPVGEGVDIIGISSQGNLDETVSGARDARSSQREVRNPLLALPAMQRMRLLSPASRHAIVDLLNDLAKDAADRAERSWRQNKGPMAAYWKAVSVYAKHARAAVRP